jgi:N-acetylglucosamine-6-phosphate deacetylase
MRLRARHFATGERIEVVHQDGHIRSVGPPGPERPDREAGWIAPGFFDLQVNGCDGHSFNSERLTADSVRHVVDVCRQHGIVGLCPTLVTNHFVALAHGLETLRRARESDAEVARAVPAIHLEGPHISPEDGPRGAHPRQHVRPPDWDEFRRLQDVAGGLVRLVTLAPEHEGSLPFIERLTASGVVVSLGHTAASGARIRDAVAAGARLSTHLGNGCHAMLPRHDNPLWEQLAADDLWVSVISDGHHLPSAVLRCILRVKTPARSIITCDASSLAGLPPGRYTEWGGEFEILPEGKIIVPGTPYLAGSCAFTDVCVERMIELTGLGLGDAVEMAGARPRSLLRLPAVELAEGGQGGLVLFDWQPGGRLQVTGTIL